VYWSVTLATWSDNSKEQWSKINGAIKPPTVQQFQLTAAELAAQFAGKEDKIHASMSLAEPPTFRECSTVAMVSAFWPVTLSEVHHLLMGTPCKRCILGWAPMWLVKHAVDMLASDVTAICTMTSFVQLTKDTWQLWHFWI